MMKVEIVLDEDKIKAEGEYEVDEIKRCVCVPFEEKGLRRLETGDRTIVFCDKNRDNDYAWLWRANLILVDEDWFVRYVKKWIWEDEDGQEDVIAGFKKHRLGAYA